MGHEIELIVCTVGVFGFCFGLYHHSLAKIRREREADPRPHPLQDILSAPNPMERRPTPLPPQGFSLPVSPEEAKLIEQIDAAAPRRPSALHAYEEYVMEKLEERIRQNEATKET